MSEGAADESNSSLLYIISFGITVISFLLYKFVLSAPATTGEQTGLSSRTTTIVGAAASQSATSNNSSSNNNNNKNSTPSVDEDDFFTFGRPRYPPHLLPPAGVPLNHDYSNCLLKGVVPFRSTPASTYEGKLKSNYDGVATEDNIVVTNRKERARIFARMFSAKGNSSTASRPPNKGANIVVTIHHSDVQCPNLQKALYLLGSYYNLFVLVDASSTIVKGEKEMCDFIKKSRALLLNEDSDISQHQQNTYKLDKRILPPHRVTLTSTVTGRIAFVRQLAGTQLVLDNDENVTNELTRFGFRTLTYPRIEADGQQHNSAVPISSSLGKFLIG